jgi:hypothetical protein
MRWTRSGRRCVEVVIAAALALTASLFAIPVAKAALPDQRRYELVSPPQKQGSDISVDSTRTRVAIEGNAVLFSSLGGFADLRGTGVATEYLSQRVPGKGWMTHAVTPLQEPRSFEKIVFGAPEPRYVGQGSDDLAVGIFLSNRRLTADGANVDLVPNFYLRDDLRTPGAGSYELVTDSQQPVSSAGAYKPWFAGTSKDFTHIVFSSILPLVPGVPDQPPSCGAPPFFSLLFCDPQLYEWVKDQGIRAVGILPESEGGGLAPRSIAGQGQSAGAPTPHVVSEDGSRIIFTVQSDFGAPEGRIYMRENGSTTLRINASERTEEPDTERPATYWNASEDGSIVYFTTFEQLTDDDTNGTVDLYQWRRSSPSGSRLTRVSVDEQPDDPPNDVSGVLAASPDGSYVYFVAASQLVEGAPPRPESTETLLFGWHAGEVFYVGTASDLFDLLPIAGTGTTDTAVRVSRDGTKLMFTSRAKVGLTGYDNADSTICPFAAGGGGCNEVYLFSADPDGGSGGTLVCISCRPDGSRAQGDAAVLQRFATGGSAGGEARPRFLSDGGERAFFSTVEPLVAEDTNGQVGDVYSYDVRTGELGLISSGRSPSPSFFLGASSNGDDVFFATREQLVASDVDSSFDLYDARVRGGFPEPVPPPDCERERCRGTVSPSTGLPGPGGSLEFEGAVQTSPRPKISVTRPTKRQLARLAHGRPIRLVVRVSRPGRVRLVVRAFVEGRSVVIARARARHVRPGSTRIAVTPARRAIRALPSATVRARILVRYVSAGVVVRKRISFQIVAGGR